MVKSIENVRDYAERKLIGAELMAGGALSKAAAASPVVMTALMMSRSVLADGDNNADSAKQAITAVLNILFLITNVIGILFVAIGIVRIVIAHSQEDAPGQQKAAMFIATGLALILLRLVLSKVGFVNWININYDPSAGTGGSGSAGTGKGQ